MRQKTRSLATAIVLAGLALAGGVLLTPGARQQASAAQQSPVNTVKVERRELSATTSEGGILTYRAQADGSPYSVFDEARGIYTKLPAPGQVISQGHVLYRVDDLPVVLLQGSTPAYRTLAAGMSGPDVAELNADLVALGYATSAQLGPASNSFGPATTTAVMKLQVTLGVTETGVLTLGQAVFEPSAMRVTNVSAQLGGRTDAGATVMQGTSTTRQVEIALSASEQSTIAVGDKVSITLPNDRITPGVVSSVGSVAVCPSNPVPEAPGASAAGSGTDACSSGSSPSSTPAITVGVTPSDPAATGSWDQAPVQVGITTASVASALVVPVSALLAQPGSGYAVEVGGAGAGDHLVPVSLGLFDDADGLVQVTASGLTAGQQVVVPST
jgi:peptidoglycan hydrolase-like protein with peptidoglycan-binding domain